ncbi:MAG TPA: hypothetical protein VG675_23430 [Bryobacteraceae bacterium]|nr:hypothetical protein [Bryobacteraceae bacterium]
MQKFDDIYTESNGTATFTLGLNGKNGKLFLENAAAAQSMLFDGDTNTITLGGDKAGSGTLSLNNGSGKDGVVIRATTPVAFNPASTPVMRGLTATPEIPKTGGYLSLRTSEGKENILLDGSIGSVTIGGGGEDGALKILTASGAAAIALTGSSSTITVGVKGAGGDVHLQSEDGQETLVLRGSAGIAAVGGGGKDGVLIVKGAGDKETVILKGATGSLILGGAGGHDGDITIKTAAGNNTITLDGSDALLTLGGVGANGDIIIKNDNDIETIKITGADGDITFLNADVAEEFDVPAGLLDDVAPGVVVVLDEEGRIVPCERAYDGRVAGIVAGAGSYRPGIVLDRSGAMNRRPVALAGKVYCWVDAGAHSVRAGDLLTTSSNRGHAMAATDRARAFGSVIGKALRPLTSGCALIPVLVTPR